MRALIAVFFAAGAAQAQTPFDKVFDQMKAKEIKARKGIFATESEEWSALQCQAASAVASRRAPEPSTPRSQNVSAGFDQLTSASVNTDVDGAEAGVNIVVASSCGASGIDHQLVLTAAALKDTKSRFGFTYSNQTHVDPLGPGAAGLTPCKADWQAFEAEIDDLKSEMAQVCAAAIAPSQQPPVPPPSAPVVLPQESPEEKAAREKGAAALQEQKTLKLREAWKHSRVSCGLEPGEPLALKLARDNLIVTAKALGYAPENMPKLSHYKSPHADGCYTQDDIAAASKQVAWSAARIRVGASAAVELYPRIFGFQPDPSTPLPNGDLQRYEGGFTVGYSKGRFAAALGASGGQQRTELSDPLRAFIAPTATVSFVAASLSDSKLLDDSGRVNLTDDGDLPATLTLGVEGRVEVAVDRLTEQTTPFNQIKVTPFADFKISDKVAFRVGAPLDGEIAVRKEDKTANVTAQRSLQWTIPIFVTTVLKL